LCIFYPNKEINDLRLCNDIISTCGQKDVQFDRKSIYKIMEDNSDVDSDGSDIDIGNFDANDDFE
jgi:hypothetical protein